MKSRILRMNKLKTKNIIFNIVFIVFVIKILLLVLQEPYIGIANNGDFQRLMDPVGLSYSEDIWLEENRETYFYRYITNDFIITEPVKNGWNQVFSIFPYMAIGMSRLISNNRFDLRCMGFINAFFYFIAVYLLFSLIKYIQSMYSYVLLGVFAIMLSDTYIIQYFNCFYSEIGSVTSCLMLWCLFIYSFIFVSQKGVAIKVFFVVLDSLVAVLAILCKQ